jgi:predicted nuclease with TOPRIM domain
MTAFPFTAIVLSCLAVLPVMGQQKPKSSQQSNTNSANAQIVSLRNQVKTLTEERDALKLKVDEIPDILRQENAELYRQIDEAEAQKEQLLDELEQVKATLQENQSGGDSLLRELQQAKNDLRRSNNRVELLEKEVVSLEARFDDAVNIKDGAFVQYGPNIVPAECLNLRRMTPEIKRAVGVVVVNCLINELGDTEAVCLIQGLPGKVTEWTLKAHEACLEAAKRLVFKPATKNGVRLKVWQGVGFVLN